LTDILLNEVDFSQRKFVNDNVCPVFSSQNAEHILRHYGPRLLLHSRKEKKIAHKMKWNTSVRIWRTDNSVFDSAAAMLSTAG